MMKENSETSEVQNHIVRNQDSINNFMTFSQKNTITQEQEHEMSNWRSSSKLKAAIFYFLAGLYLLIAGIIFQIKYDEINEIRKDYYLLEGCVESMKNQNDKSCQFEVSVSDKIEGPVYLFVEMKNYNQNTFTYFEKYDPSQIYDNISDNNENHCKPYKTNGDMKGKANKNFQKTVELDSKATAFPCGLRAYDHFTDTFTVKNKQTGTEYQISTKDISWKYDREHIKNKDISKQWIDLEDERIQVWMRPSGLSKFRKTIGKIEKSLDVGTYVITTTNQYIHTEFDSTKTLIISNVNSMGGKGLLLVVSHLAGGSIAIFASIGLALWHMRKKLPQ